VPAGRPVRPGSRKRIFRPRDVSIAIAAPFVIGAPSSLIAAREKSLRRRLVVAAGARRNVPAHRIGQPVVDVEQKRNFQSVPDSLFGDAGAHHRPDIFGREIAVIERHLLEQPQRRSQLLVNRRVRVVVQHPLGQRVVSKGGRRDRGVSVGSKQTLVQPRDERGEQLALAHRPFGRAAHDGLRVRGMRSPEAMRVVLQYPDHVGCTEAGHRTHDREEQLHAEAIASVRRCRASCFLQGPKGRREPLVCRPERRGHDDLEELIFAVTLTQRIDIPIRDGAGTRPNLLHQRGQLLWSTAPGNRIAQRRRRGARSLEERRSCSVSERREALIHDRSVTKCPGRLLPD
jgi:hypothetical protein